MVGPVRLSGESDAFVGVRRRLRRFLVCSNNGFFPVVVKTGAKKLAVIYRVDATHVGINGSLAVSVSEDGGERWSGSVRITPNGEDARNPAFGVNADGDLIAAFWKAGLQSYALDENGNIIYSPKDRDNILDVDAMFYCKSADGGTTWSDGINYHSELLKLASPYGRIITAPNGRMLMSVYGASREKTSEDCRDICILTRSADGGESWGDESVVAYGYNEASYLYLSDGALLCAARSEAGSVSVLRSEDDGYTWSAPQEITRIGEHPADLTLLENGLVMLTFGRRIRPMGCGLLFSNDMGKTWNRKAEVLLAGDGVLNTDLGYPSSVQLDDGSILTLLYYASGSQASQDFTGWGEITLQAIKYRFEDVNP